MAKRKAQNSVVTAFTTEIVCDGTDLFVVENGVRIARRGYPGTKQARTWVSLEPGFSVRDDDPNAIVVEYCGPSLQ
jgi:hypothetical protein